MDFLNDQVNIYRGCEFIQFARRTYRNNEPIPRSERHMHQHFELFIMLDGEIDFIIEENRRLLVRGDIALIRSGEYHVTPTISGDCYDHCYFQFSERSFPELSGSVRAPVDCFSERPAGSMNYLTPQKSAWNRLTSLIERLCKLIRDKDRSLSTSLNKTETGFEKYAVTLEILSIIAAEWRESYAERVADDSGEHSVHPIVANALNHIERNFLTINTVEEIADYCGVSHAYLSRLFREKIGTTPGAFLREKRLAFAKQRLLDGNDVTNVCYDAGFRNYSYFIQLFKQHTGMTPFAFQSMHGILRR